MEDIGGSPFHNLYQQSSHTKESFFKITLNNYKIMSVHRVDKNLMWEGDEKQVILEQWA